MISVSVITICYNSEDSIEDTIRSVIGQDYKNMEYIIVDGMSSDLTMKIVNDYRAKIDIVVSERDKGIYDAINKGITLASGDYIVLLNSNDIFYSPSTISNIANFHQHNDCPISISDVIFNDKKGQLVRYYSAKFWKPFHLRLGFMPPHQGVVIRKDIFNSCGGYSLDYKIAADYEYLVKLLLRNSLVYKYSPEVRTIMSTGGVSSQGFSSYKKISREIIDILGYSRNVFLKGLVYFRFLPKFLSSKFFKLKLRVNS
jgi:glycosyltransferase involved in cell wall biosynthesis